MKNRTGSVVSLILLIGFGWLVWNYQNVRDYFALQDFSPTLNVQQIAKDDTMTSRGQDLFFMTHPAVYDRTDFGQHCPLPEAGTNVLGCYSDGILDSGSIALFKIDNGEVADEIDVTAAHETLHSAWSHLKPWEQDRVKKMIDEALPQIPDSEKTDVIKNYISQGNYNELHSHLGTEIPVLPADFENYYKRYFSDRRKIAEIHQGNESLFNQCTTQENDLTAQLTSDRASLDQLKARIQAMRQTMQLDENSGDIAGYNALVPQHNALVRQFNNLVSVYNSGVDQIHSVINQCNALSTSYDSSQIPLQSLDEK